MSSEQPPVGSPAWLAAQQQHPAPSPLDPAHRWTGQLWVEWNGHAWEIMDPQPDAPAGPAPYGAAPTAGPGAPGVTGYPPVRPPGGIKWWYIALPAGALVLIAAIIALAVAASSGGSDENKAGSYPPLHGKVTFYGAGAGGSCEPNSEAISAGTPVAVFNPAGTQVVASSLDAPILSGSDCEFPFTLNDVPRGESFYNIQVGTGSKVGFTPAEMEAGPALKINVAATSTPSPSPTQTSDAGYNYPPAERTDFMNGCVAAGAEEGSKSEAKVLCACFLHGFEQLIPYEEFLAGMRLSAKGKKLPAEMTKVLNACVADPSAY